jgi:lipoate-protein ligase A
LNSRLAISDEMEGTGEYVDSSNRWRLIVDQETDGASNMAIDEAIVTMVLEGASLPTLRFYGWSPPCLSLGRSQPYADTDLAACRGAGVDIVRRPSGGRAILHTDELTYSVALLQADPLAAGGILESYRRLSQGLLAGLQLLGVQAEQAASARKPMGDPSAVCFETPSDYEITTQGRKLVGSAQWRARGGVLQHGTLPLCGDITRIINYLVLPGAERETQRQFLRTRATTLEASLGCSVPFARAASALADGFAQALDLQLVSGALTTREQDLAAELRRSRYAAPDWTQRT